MSQSFRRKFIKDFIPPEFEPAWEIIQREQLAEAIGEELARVIRAPVVAPPVVVPKIRFPATALRFLKPHQYLTVPAGSTKRVYFYRLPGDHLGVIQRVGNTHYSETKATWRVDGKDVYGQPIEREIANINCVMPDTQVIINSGVKPISDLSIGDSVLTHTGEYKRVLAVKSRPHDGEIVRIKAYYLNKWVEVSPEHPIFAIKTHRCAGVHRICRPTCAQQRKRLGKWGVCHKLYWKEYTPSWIPAGELKDGDLLVYPLLKIVKDIQFIYLSDYIDVIIENGLAYAIGSNQHQTRMRSRGKPILNKIAMNRDFMRLCGYYLAEGTANENYLNFTLGRNETNLVEDILKLLKRCFDIEGKVYAPWGLKGSEICVNVGHSIVSRFFKRLFGAHSYEKSLPQFFMTLPNYKQAALLDGMFKGDGYNWKTMLALGYSTVSEKLAIQLQLIFFRLKILSSIIEDNRDTLASGKYKRRKGYVIAVFGKSADNLIPLINQEHKHPQKRKYNYGWIDENYAYLPIKNVERKYYRGALFDVAIDGAKSFVGRGACLHNSPLELRPPIEVTNRIEWIVKNEGASDVEYHVLIDGISCHKSEFDVLLSWLKAGG